MIRVIRAGIVLLILAVIASLAAWLANNPGELAAEWQGRRIEMSVAVALVLIAVGVGVLAGLVMLLNALRPKSLMARKRGFDSARGYRALTNGLVAIAAGDPQEALRQAKRARSLLKDAPASLLISAQAAEMRGDHDEARKQFSAMLEAPETEFVGLRGLMAEAMRAGDRNRARALVRRAHALRPKTPWVLEALFAFECEAGEWKEAQAALEARAKAGLEDKSRLVRKRAVLMAERAKQAQADGRTVDALDFALKAHRLARDLPDNAARAALLLAGSGKIKKARSVLAEAFAALPHPLLVATDAALDPNEKPKDRLKRMEKFAARAGHTPTAEIAVAEAAIHAEQWEKAGQALAAVPDDKRTRRHWQLESERLRQGLGRVDAAREAMMQAAQASDPSWRCRSCGRGSESWQAICPSCLSFDSQEWSASEKAASLYDEADTFTIETLDPIVPVEPVMTKPSPRTKPAPPPTSSPARSYDAGDRPPAPPLEPADFGPDPARPKKTGKDSDEIVVLDNPIPPSDQGVPKDDPDDFDDPQSVARQTP